MPINQMTQQSNFLLAALAGAERVFEVMDEAPEVDEGAVSLEKAGQGWAWHKPEGEDIPCGAMCALSMWTSATSPDTRY